MDRIKIISNEDEQFNKVQDEAQPLGTVRPLYRKGVSLLSRERFLYI